MMKALFLPTIENEEKFQDMVARAAWHLLHYNFSEIRFLLVDQKIGNQKWAVPAGMDPEIERCYERLAKIASFHAAQNDQDWDYCQDIDVVLWWDENARQASHLDRSIRKRLEGVKEFRVDSENVNQEASFYVEAGLYSLGDEWTSEDSGETCFKDFVHDLGPVKTAYIIATGPSSSEYASFDYDQSISIVCNSTILNDDLMKRCNPRFLVFADPIFHFGPSMYAAEFRYQVAAAAANHDFLICVPKKFYRQARAMLPELGDRLVGITHEHRDEFNLNLLDSFVVKTTPNILTYLMVPIACSVANEVKFLGCDGRPVDQDDYFWSHGTSVQFNDEMNNIKEIHPGFFRIDYNQYYLSHCYTLEQQFLFGEQLGIRFQSPVDSYIPALKRRSEKGATREDKNIPDRLLIIDPDAKSGLGHFVAYNDYLSTATLRYKVEVDILCRFDLDPKIVAKLNNYYPELTGHSWWIGNRQDNTEHVEAFKREVVEFFEYCCPDALTGDESVTVYIYTGSLQHYEALVDTIGQYDNIRIVVNLFWLANLDLEDPKFKERWRNVLLYAAVFFDSHRATAPTLEKQAEIEKAFGVKLPVAPHPSTTFDDDNFHARHTSRKETEHDGDRPLQVLFPSLPREEKGYGEILKTVEALSQAPKEYRCRFRHVVWEGTPKSFATLPETLRQHADILEGELDSDQFVDMFEWSDVVVLPYDPKHFGKRTSGLLIDALYMGRPCITVRGTWLANIIEKTGAGIAVECAEADHIVTALQTIRKFYSQYRIFARQAAANHFANNSWDLLVRDTLGLPKTERIEPDKDAGYNREDQVRLDEVKVVASYFRSMELANGIMIDVGAHYGGSTRHFADKSWTIYCFEPDDANREHLVGKYGKHSNVVIDKRAVSDVGNQTVPFYASSESTGISGLSAFRDTHEETGRVATTTVADIVKENKLRQIDFLKIDTEGFDLMVLKGVPWASISPRVILCEFEDAKTTLLGYTYHELAQFLVSQGYTVYVSEWWPVIRYGITHDWRQFVSYPAELENQEGWGNLLAFKEPPSAAELKGFVQTALTKEKQTSNASLPAKNQTSMVSSAVPRQKDDLDIMSEAETASCRDELVRRLPTRSKIFLPTEKIPLRDQVRGLQRVKEIYETKLDEVYRGRLKRLKESFADYDRCFIIGNGPSLKQTDLSLLKDEITFSVNGFFLLGEEIDWVPTFYVVEDHLVAEDRKEQIAAFRGPTKLFPAYLGYCFDESEDTIFFNHRPRKSYPDGFDFSTDAAKITYTGCTVTFTCIQLAYYLGFREIYLIGVDADYVLPNDVNESKEYDVAVLDMESADPNHFHPGYFGKGYRWHDPQIDKMVDAYREARRVVENHGRTIKNATVGGKLEVFDRVDFHGIFRSEKPLGPESVSKSLRLPRVVVFDLTLCGDGTATGELKANLFEGWPKNRFLQFYTAGDQTIGAAGALGFFDRLKRTLVGQRIVDEHDVVRLVSEFAPELILYRITPEQSTLHEAAMKVIRDNDSVPLVMWIVDDWPSRLKMESPALHDRLDKGLKELFARASLNLSIGSAMSEAFKERYGVSFKSFANGVKPEEWPDLERDKGTEHPLTVRYAGALASNMVLDSVVRIAEAVEALAQADVNIRFEIKTSELWFERSKTRFSGLSSTTLFAESLSPVEYRQWLSTADAVVIAYNFCERARAYVRYSVANKLPECLASGAVLLAYGPEDLSTISYIDKLQCAIVVKSEDKELLKGELRAIVEDPIRRKELAAKARAIAFKDHNLYKIQADFRTQLAAAARSSVTNGQKKDLATKVRDSKPEKVLQTGPRQSSARGLTYFGSFALFVKNRSRAVYRVGQLSKWIFSAIGRSPKAFIAVLILLTALVGVPAYSESLWQYRLFFWGAAGLVGFFLIALAGIVVGNEALRRLLEARGVEMDVRISDARRSIQTQLGQLERNSESMKEEIDRIRQDTGKYRGRLRKEIIGTLDKRLNAVYYELDRKITSQDQTQRAAMESLHRELMAMANERVSDLTTEVQQFAETQEKLQAEFQKLTQEVENEEAARKTRQVELEQRINTLMAELNSAQEEADRQIDRLKSRLEQDNTFQSFNRVFSEEHNATIQTNWAKRLGVRVTRQSLAYIANRIRVTEQNALGRLATSVEDAVLRTLVSSAPRTSKLEILEIGTLFGIGLAMMYECNRGRYDKIHLTAIDPLDGYYNEKVPDVLLNIPITRETFWRNMHSAGVPEEDVTLITEMSTTDEAMEQAAKKKYDLLVIDGDHSYAGVKTDFENYWDMVRRGGFIIFDDYGATDWPDVKQFVDNEVMGLEQLVFVGHEWRTAIFRVVKKSITPKKRTKKKVRPRQRS